MMDLKNLNKLLGTGLFILSFFWFFFPAEYVLIANRDIRIFITTPDYLWSFLDRPGGLLEYAGSFLNQFLRFRVVGALLLAGVITMGYFVVGQVITRISGKRKLLIVGLVTPALYNNVLPGITRDTVIQLAKDELGIETVERSVTRAELYTADECFLTGTAAHITPVAEIDHRQLGNGRPGEITARLQKLYFEVIKGENPKYRDWCTPAYKK